MIVFTIYLVLQFKQRHSMPWFILFVILQLFQYTKCTESNGGVTDEYERIWKEAVMV
jgi:hypothetical protein